MEYKGLPRYKCHKEVHALKILGFRVLNPELNPSGPAIIIPESPYDRFEVDVEWIKKHKPQPGGYYVMYDDGYASYSPAKAFEEGYTRI